MRERPSVVGVDFDNTLVCYDNLFHALAVERGLVDPETPASKTVIRDRLRAAGIEAAWTELQGIAYGPAILRAEPYPGARRFLQACRDAGVRVAIVSHKTKHPFLGDAHDLHAAAYAWLEANGMIGPVAPDDVYFELTKAAKIARVASLGCRVFVDDLPELLLDAAFPTGVSRILFDPLGLHDGGSELQAAAGWNEVERLVADSRAVAR